MDVFDDGAGVEVDSVAGRDEGDVGSAGEDSGTGVDLRVSWLDDFGVIEVFALAEDVVADGGESWDFHFRDSLIEFSSVIMSSTAVTRLSLLLSLRASNARSSLLSSESSWLATL